MSRAKRKWRAEQERKGKKVAVVCDIHEIKEAGGYAAMCKDLSVTEIIVTGMLGYDDKRVGITAIISQHMPEKEALACLKETYDINPMDAKKQRLFWIPINNMADVTWSHMDDLGSMCYSLLIDAFDLKDEVLDTPNALRKDGQPEAADALDVIIANVKAGVAS